MFTDDEACMGQLSQVCLGIQWAATHFQTGALGKHLWQYSIWSQHCGWSRYSVYYGTYGRVQTGQRLGCYIPQLPRGRYSTPQFLCYREKWVLQNICPPFGRRPGIWKQHTPKSMRTITFLSNKWIKSNVTQVAVQARMWCLETHKSKHISRFIYCCIMYNDISSYNIIHLDNK